jgi:hypothetical protein
LFYLGLSIFRVLSSEIKTKEMKIKIIETIKKSGLKISPEFDNFISGSTSDNPLFQDKEHDFE